MVMAMLDQVPVLVLVRAASETALPAARAMAVLVGVAA
jgi:hypothetical protein